jgi:hypothetical protein
MAPAAAGPVFDSKRASQYESKTTPAVVIIAIVAASGGLIFGERRELRIAAPIHKC